MLKLQALKFEKVWGYELWLASTHKNGFQKDFAQYAGGEYPLLVKIIQANDTLSVQVHPDDETAAALEGEGNIGKTECWYVLDAEKDARLVYGLSGQHCAAELSSAIKSFSLEKYLNSVPVKKGDFVFIPAGTVHAIGGGLRLLEVQQSCDLTYRLYDWGRPREVHIEKGLRSIKNDFLKKIAPFAKSFCCKYFSLEEIKISGKHSEQNFGKEKNASDTILFFILEGSGIVCEENSTKENSAEKFSEEKVQCENSTKENCDAKNCEKGASIEFKAEDIFALGPKEKIAFKSEAARVLKISCSKK